MIKKTPDEWLKIQRFENVTVLDPDGWDRRNFVKSWAEEITEGEMHRRLIMSTCMTHQDDVQKSVRDGMNAVINGVSCTDTKGI